MCFGKMSKCTVFPDRDFFLPFPVFPRQWGPCIMFVTLWQHEIAIVELIKIFLKIPFFLRVCKRPVVFGSYRFLLFFCQNI